MDIILVPLFNVFALVIGLFRFVLIAYIILSWLELFNVVNRYNQFVYTIHTILFRLVEPVLNPIRNLLPNLGGLDLAPLVAFIALYFFESLLVRILLRFPS